MMRHRYHRVGRQLTPRQKKLLEAKDRTEFFVEVLSTGFAERLRRGFYDGEEYRLFRDMMDDALNRAVAAMDITTQEYDDSFKRAKKKATKKA
jgi:hypothetical protein